MPVNYYVKTHETSKALRRMWRKHHCAKLEHFRAVKCDCVVKRITSTAVVYDSSWIKAAKPAPMSRP